MVNLREMLDGVVGEGESFMAKCPAHDDRSPSMRVTYRDDRILLYCCAGCTAQDILDSLNLSWSDLFNSQWTAAERQAYAQKQQLRKVDPMEVEMNIILIMNNKRKNGESITAEDEARDIVARQRYSVYLDGV